MSLLRIFLDRAAPERDFVCAWALFDRRAVVRTGRSGPDHWPSAERLEGLVGADVARVVRVVLPPIPGARLVDAVRFALEDQMLGSTAETAVNVQPQQRDGAVRAVLVDRAWLTAVDSGIRRFQQSFAALCPRSELFVPSEHEWLWIDGVDDSPGFVVRDDRSAFAVDSAGPAALPAALTLALAELPAGDRPRAIRAAGAADVTALARETTVPVTAIAALPWHGTAPGWPPGSLDLPVSSRGRAEAAPAPSRVGALRWGAGLLVAACLVHVGFAAAAWWRAERLLAGTRAEMRNISAAVAGDRAGSLEPYRAVEQRLREMRTAAREPAPDDMAAILGRASAALTGLPKGGLRAIVYSERHVVIELATLPADRLARMQRELATAGLTSIAAPVPAGYRLRIGIRHG